MRAVGVMNYGGPEALEIVEVPEEHAGPGQVRLRVHAAAVNPTDTYVRNGARAEMQRDLPPPYVPGMDAAGIVDEVGDGVTTGLAVGDRAMAIVVPHGAHGAYRQSLVLPAESVTLAPAGTTHAEASTLPMNGLTARLSLDLLGLTPGQTLAVTGAAGAYGGYVVQLAKADGLTVIADASEADTELVRSLGADFVVARGDDVAERIRQLAPNGVDGLADGAVQNELVIPAVADGGAFTSIRGFRPDADPALTRGIAFTVTMVRDYQLDWARLDHLRQQAEGGQLTLRVADVYPATEAAAAHARLEAGGTRGRCVIDLS
ncbi:MAG: NADP-dependent oxidoreductase [Acidimicrobiales bacterium]